jgi:peptide/nickel transport system permease protein
VSEDPGASRGARPRTGQRRSSKGLLGVAIVVSAVAVATFAPQIAPYSPTRQAILNRFAPPVWLGGSPAHPLGTDGLGRDVLSRIIHGSRISVFVGVAAVILQGGLGTTLGLLAGYYGGRVDGLIMQVADVQLALPFLILTLAIVAVLGPGLENVILSLGITGWVLYCRTVRGEVLSLRERDFIHAARALGMPNTRILARQILPNVLPSLVVIGTLQVPRMILFEASLSYLGLGIQPPTPSWGAMVAEGRDVVALAWWVATLPGLAIMTTVLGMNLLGDSLRDRLDPYQRGR